MYRRENKLIECCARYEVGGLPGPGRKADEVVDVSRQTWRSWGRFILLVWAVRGLAGDWSQVSFILHTPVISAF